MVEIYYLRLLYSGLLAVLLALLAYTFVPAHSRLKAWVERYCDSLIWVLWVGAAIVLWGMGALKFAGMHNSAADLGLYANTLWVTLHGKLLGTAITSGTYLNCHFSPSFLLLALLYAPWQSPIWLIGMQDITAASGALALYLLVKHLSGSRLSGLLFGFLWVSSFALRGATLYDFHEVTMISGLLMWLTYLIIKDKWLPALLLALFLLGIKEDIPVYLAVLGFLIAGSFKKMKWGFSLIGLSIIYYTIMQLYIWPALAPYHLDFIALRFPILATEDGNVIAHILSNPLILSSFVNQNHSLWLLLMVLLPTLLLPFTRWGSIGLLLPLWMIVNLDISSFFLFATYHHICTVALFYIAAIPGWFWLMDRIKVGRRLVYWLLLSMGITLNLAIPHDLLFSQLDPASYSEHPSFARARKVAQETPPAVSIAVDRMMGSLYTDHYFVDMFPSKVFTDRMYLSPASISSPHLVLALGGLGYKGITTDPYCWFLGRDGNIDLRESFMDKMRWMEAENSNLAAWQLVNDPRASGRQALFLPSCGDWGQRMVKTPALMLPPGEYCYGIRMRTVHANRSRPIVYAEVKQTGTADMMDQLIVDYQIPISEAFFKTNYEYFYCQFIIDKWTRVYLNLNFSVLDDVYWDGISLQGLEQPFDSYYQQLFPQCLEAYRGCADQSVIIQDQDSCSGFMVEFSQKTQGQEIVVWNLDSNLPEGDYTLYYTDKSTEPIEENTDWAIVLSTDHPDDLSTYQEIAQLHITRDYMETGSLRLENLRLRLKPNTTLVFWVKEGLDKKILLDKLWISPLE